jgi:exodeoxyribonuclease-5
LTGNHFIEKLLEAFPFEPTAGQMELAEKLSAFITDPDPKAVFVLKGYAGTGKTSFISAMVRMLPSMGIKPVLMAPTGRAAKVFSGYSGLQAFTIHRRIYFQGRTRDGNILLTLQNNLYKNALFIVDEASMIAGNFQEGDNVFRSRNLLDDLLTYVRQGNRCRLMLIGDTAQLPPVGMDISPALDINYLKTRYSLKLHVHELTEVMRQALESGILANATRLRQMLAAGNPVFPLLTVSGLKDVMNIDNLDLEDKLNTAYSRDSMGKAVVICRSNKRANMFNREIRNRILYQENELNAGDHLMVVKNNYFWLDARSFPGFIANGDIVEVMRIQRTEEEYGFRFADVTIRMKDYPDDPTQEVKIILDTLMSEAPALTSENQNRLFQAVMEEYQDIPTRSERFGKVRTNPFFNALQVKFAYAMTCHKTQGGQWEEIFIDDPGIKPGEAETEDLRWLYTALTRATARVFLINFTGVLKKGSGS